MKTEQVKSDGQGADRMKTEQVKSDHLRGHSRGHFPGHLRGEFLWAILAAGEVSTFASTVVSTLVGAVVGAVSGTSICGVRFLPSPTLNDLHLRWLPRPLVFLRLAHGSLEQVTKSWNLLNTRRFPSNPVCTHPI